MIWEDEVRPHVDELEHGDLAPYDILRNLIATFGMDPVPRDQSGLEAGRHQVGGLAIEALVAPAITLQRSDLPSEPPRIRFAAGARVSASKWAREESATCRVTHIHSFLPP